MGFTVRDFNDPIRLLDRHPEWVEALRQRLLTRELLTSPPDPCSRGTQTLMRESS